LDLRTFWYRKQGESYCFFTNPRAKFISLTSTLKSLEDMDVVFGDTAAFEEKQRMRQIEAQLSGQHLSVLQKEKIISEEHVE
jgi:hypothetical protein